MAAKSVDALPVITFDHRDVEGDVKVLADGKQVGTIRKSEYNPRMMYLKLDGVLWHNTPGARYRADAGTFPETAVTSFTMARLRIEQHYKDKAEALAKQQGLR